MLDLVLKWAVPFLCGAAVSFAISLLVKLRAVKSGMQCLLRAEIVRSYDKYTAKGFCPIYAKEALKKAYDAYHALGGNDVATSLYHLILDLPTEGGAPSNDHSEC